MAPSLPDGSLRRFWCASARLSACSRVGHCLVLSCYSSSSGRAGHAMTMPCPRRCLVGLRPLRADSRVLGVPIVLD
eukprot:391543-Rhodomonas_salina.3